VLTKESLASAAQGMGNRGSVCGTIEDSRVPWRLGGTNKGFQRGISRRSVRKQTWQSMSAPERERLFEKRGTGKKSTLLGRRRRGS